MSLPELCIRRPVMTTLFMAAILLFGIMGYRALPVSDLPNVDYPTIQVSAALPGASPETMASAVATPLERQFSTIAGMDSMTSSSYQGVSNITLQFNLSRSIDAAAQDVQASITQAQRLLPPGMPSPPSFQKVNPADQPVLYMAVYSTTLPLSTVDEYAETFMANRISMVSGVAQVSVYGAQKYAVRIQLNPKALASEGIGIDQAVAAVQQANVNLPTGTLDGSKRSFTVQANGQLEDAAAYQPLIVAYRNGAPVYLNQVANIIDSVQNNKAANWYDGNRGMVLAIQRQPGTNTVEVVDNIRALLPQLRLEIPASIHLETLYDRSVGIRASVSDVKFTLWLTIGLVVMVIFLFLRNISATIIPSLALPMSIVGTFAVMYMLGYTVDNLSLMALVLSVGFVVDDAIVMLENIVRHMEHGEGVLEAARHGSREIGFTIMSMTLSLTSVFIPVLFMGGIVGRLLHEFSVTIMAAVLVSGFVSLTLTPMLSSRFLRNPRTARHGALYRFSERGFKGLLRGYDWSLRGALRHRFLTMLASFAVLGATVYMYEVVPKGFLPSEDSGEVIGFTLAQQGISFKSMQQHTVVLLGLLRQDPNVDNVMAFAGSGGPLGGLNSGFFFAHLKDGPARMLAPPPQREGILKAPGAMAVYNLINLMAPRHMSTDDVINELRPKLGQVTGMVAFMQNPPPIRIGGQLSKSLYQYTVQGVNTQELYRTAAQLEAAMNKLPGLVGVNSDMQIANPQVNVEINRDKASALGVTAYQVENALALAYGSTQVSTIYTPSNEYWVIAELQPDYQADPAALPLLYIQSSNGRLVPLNAVADFVQNLGPLSVNHFGQLPAVTISFDLQPGVSLGAAVSEVNNAARRILPATLSGAFQGAAQQFESSSTGLGILLLATVLVIYIVLGILYESFIHPLTILSGLPSAAFGALLTLKLFNMELDLYGFVGIIMLIGIVKKNAIMMIDFALAAERNEGKSTAAAIYEGALIRFRPIMMTTMAALMGTLPIAIGFGAGAESRRPLGLCVVGGLVFSQLITLYITPVYYTYLDGFQRWLGRTFGRRGKTEGKDEEEGIPLPEPVEAGRS
ncbi:MAG TPA: efflux RND transporter permease subunit [Terriglobia bacterium]|nr:efflux RND transporter permease subunit [Terriglobia bacterium]